MPDSPILGCILGTAVADAIGLPYEGVSRARAPKLLGPPDRYRFLGRRGMVSDDTEHTCMVAQSLIGTGGDVDSFRKDFARRLRWWLLALPAGVGRATARATLKLWFGASPKTSGVFSAGNGPAMRAAIFGAALDDIELIVSHVRASSRITHSDPKAEQGAIAVALAAHACHHDTHVVPGDYAEHVVQMIGNETELAGLLRTTAASVNDRQSTAEFASELGLPRGVTGYTLHTVPVAIHAWLSNQRDYRAAVTSVIECGGDADTTAAIVGGIVGTGTGESGIPQQWIERLWEWPRSVTWMRRLAGQLEETQKERSTKSPIGVNPLAVLIRNIFFLLVVLFHGFRRLLPPY